MFNCQSEKETEEETLEREKNGEVMVAVNCRLVIRSNMLRLFLTFKWIIMAVNRYQVVRGEAGGERGDAGGCWLVTRSDSGGSSSQSSGGSFSDSSGSRTDRGGSGHDWSNE